MGDELKRYKVVVFDWDDIENSTNYVVDAAGDIVLHEDAAAAIESLQAQLAQAREQVERLTSDVSAQKKTTEIHAYQAAQYYAELEQLRDRLADITAVAKLQMCAQGNEAECWQPESHSCCKPELRDAILRITPPPSNPAERDV